MGCVTSAQEDVCGAVRATEVQAPGPSTTAARPAAPADACESEIRFGQLAEMLNDVFWINDLKPVPSTPYVSPAFERVWGHPPRALYADPKLWLRAIVAEDRARVGEAYARWLVEPETGYAVEYRIQRPDGSQRWISDRGRAVRNAGGEVYRLTGIAQDITERKLAELEASQTRRDFRELIEGLPQLAWSARADGECDYLSPQWAHYTGSPEADHLGSGWLAVVHPDDVAVLDASRQPACAARTAYDTELRLRRHDGAYRWFTLHAVPLCDEAGRLRCWFGTCTDVHDLKQANAALAEQHAQLSEIASACPSAIHSYDIQPDGRGIFSFGAARVAAMYGVPPQALADDTTVLDRLVHPEDLALIHAAMADSRARATVLHIEYRIRHAQKGERWIKALSMPGRNSDGLLVWRGTLTDVTDRKQAERALHASRAQLKAVFEDLTEGLVIYSLQTLHATFNRAALELFRLPLSGEAALSTEAFRERYELRRADGGELPFEDWPLMRVLRGERVERYELRLRHRADGWEKCISYGGSLVLDADGAPMVAVLLLSDVTDRYRHDAELQRLNAELEGRVAERTAALAEAVEEMEAFSYSVSHDLRAPLRALDGFSQAVMQDYGELLPEAGQQYLQIIRDSAKKMGQLIDDLLAFSRISRTKLNKRPVDPAMLVRDALAQLAPLREGRRIELRIGALPPCQGDLSLLRQVWINLISNALKYSRQRDLALIEIGCERDAAGRAEYFVRDNGTGFDMRYVHKLFGVFERLHRAEDFEGTGVGLAIVKRVVQRHGGDIRAQAEPGVGASFHFHLGED